MQFQWDNGNVDHIALHDITPQEAEQVIENDPLEMGKEVRDGELRVLHLGETDTGRIVIVSVTVRGERIRVVTAYPAKKNGGYFMQNRKTPAMNNTLKTPDFKSEAEEATWFDNNQDELLEQFKQAAKDGTLTRGTLARRGLTPTTTIRLDPTDIELAKTQAERRGLRYQTYLKMIIHQALAQEAGKNALTLGS